ncbi:MAG TPA: HD domain-containing phosphohydrolase [bacterium]|nr:HD domain-containing phosphohydrolase [bacterium]
MARFSPSSLSVRLIILVLLALLPGVGLTVYTASTERRQEAAHIKAQALLLARLASSNQERLVAEARQLLDSLAHFPVIQNGDPRACSALLGDLLRQHPTYANFGVIAPSGTVVCSALPLTRSVNLGDRIYFTRAMASKGFAVGEYQVGRITRKATLNFGYPVLGASGRVQSVVFAALDLAWINRLAATAELPMGATLTLIDRQGTVLARYPDPDRWMGRPAPQAGIITRMLAEAEGVAEARGMDGALRLYGFTRLRGTDGAGDVYLSVGIPTAVAYADADRQFARTLLALGLVGLLTLMVAWLGGSRYILRPVNAVVAAARRLAAGDLSARTGMHTERGELGLLMHTFDEMADTLERQTAQLREAEARYRALVEQSLVGVYLITGDRFIYVNDAFADIFGYGPDEVMAMNPLDLVRPGDRPLAGKNLQAGLQEEAEALRYTTRGLRKDGTAIQTEVFGRRVVHQGQPAILGTLIDITDRKRAEEQSQHQLKRLAALRTIDMAITASLDLRVTLHVLLEQVTLRLGVDAADVLLLNPHTQTLDYAAGRGFGTPTLQRTRLRLGEGYAGQAAQERRLITIPDLTKGAGDLDRAPLLSEEVFVAYYAVPLIAKGQVTGVLELFHRAPLVSSKDWLDFLDTLAGQAAIAIENASLFADLQRSNADLALAYDTTLEGWSRALDLRDKETEGHSRRVTEMTLQLALAMGMSEPDLVHIRRGALLHDIGKMGIPDSILNKPGPLSNEEKTIMQRHPVYAFELLSPIDYLRPALDIPYCHHEKWDGTGYPRRLRGEDIPLAARIFAVADVWDALRSGRPYRPAWTAGRARQYIRKQAGKHFDPQVVEVFLRIQGETEARTMLAAGSGRR